MVFPGKWHLGRTKRAKGLGETDYCPSASKLQSEGASKPGQNHSLFTLLFHLFNHVFEPWVSLLYST